MRTQHHPKMFLFGPCQCDDCRDVQAMLNDPGNEPSPEDLPDYVDPRKEVSPHDLHDDPLDEFDATYANPYYGDGD